MLVVYKYGSRMILDVLSTTTSYRKISNRASSAYDGPIFIHEYRDTGRDAAVYGYWLLESEVNRRFSETQYQAFIAGQGVRERWPLADWIEEVLRYYVLAISPEASKLISGANQTDAITEAEEPSMTDEGNVTADLSQYGQSVTGAVRESIGTKIKTHLVPYELILAAAVGLNYGEHKYAARNFEKGLSETDLLMSIERHTRAIMDGEFEDKDTDCPHYMLLASSVAMYVALEMRGTILRDLPTPAMRPIDMPISQLAKYAKAVEDRVLKQHVKQNSLKNNP